MRHIAAVLLLALTPTAFAEFYRDDISPNYYNDVWKTQSKLDFDIYYDEKKDVFDFYFKEPMYLSNFNLSRGQADKLIDYLDKYKEWNIKASNKGVKLEKEIGTIYTKSTAWRLGDSWHFGGGQAIRLSFFSQNTQKHQLVIQFPRLKDRNNSYSRHKPETLYFWYKDAMKLRKALTRAEVNRHIARTRKKEALEAEFN